MLGIGTLKNLTFKQVLASLKVNIITMNSAADVRGIALDEYTKTVPPGWYPYMHNYPLKLFLEKFDAWLR